MSYTVHWKDEIPPWAEQIQHPHLQSMLTDGTNGTAVCPVHNYQANDEEDLNQRIQQLFSLLNSTGLSPKDNNLYRRKIIAEVSAKLHVSFRKRQSIVANYWYCHGLEKNKKVYANLRQECARLKAKDGANKADLLTAILWPRLPVDVILMVHGHLFDMPPKVVNKVRHLGPQRIQMLVSYKYYTFFPNSDDISEPIIVGDATQERRQVPRRQCKKGRFA